MHLWQKQESQDNQQTSTTISSITRPISDIPAPPTAEEGLLLWAHDGHQVGAGHAAVQLGHLPAQTLGVVAVAEALELIPARLAPLHVWEVKG